MQVFVPSYVSYFILPYLLKLHLINVKVSWNSQYRDLVYN